MKDKIVTAKLSDLFNIFDAAVQENEDTGDARILYTFNEEGQPKRERVGENFLLEVTEPPLTLFVSVPVIGEITSGEIVVANSSEFLDGEKQIYSIRELAQLVKNLTILLGVNDDEAVSNKLNS